MAEPAAPIRSRSARWLWGVGTILLVAASGLATWQLNRSVGGSSPAAASSQPADAPPRLVFGHDYYLHVKLIELAERRPDGKAWDSVDGSGPDIKFSLKWHNNIIWKSSEKSDTLIGSWDLVKVDVRQMLTSGSSTDLEQLVNAPIVHYEPGGTVEMKVWDEDTVDSDEAGTIHLKLDELRPGENILAPKPDKTCAVRRVVLAVIDRRTPVPELVNMISNR
jgi:hypothetical protein